MRWIFALCIATRVFSVSFEDIEPSTPEEIASLTSNLLIEGYVSPVSGQISISDVDLQVLGAQNLILKRTYIPPLVLGRYHKKNSKDRGELGKALMNHKVAGWLALPYLWAGYNSRSPYFQVRDSNGLTLEFQIQGKQGILKTPSYGCTNLRGEEPSSSSDIRNTELWIDGNRVKILWPNGTQYTYLKRSNKFYLIENEILTNGKIVRYTYDKQNLIHISSTDIEGQYTYAKIDELSPYYYKGSDGRKAQFFYEKRVLKNKKNPPVWCSLLSRVSNPAYDHTMTYNKRTLLASYDAKNYPISWSYWEQKGIPCRIQNFSTPSGTTSFSYDSPIAGQKEGSTTVTHPNGSQTIYRFNKNFLLSAIENWHQGKLYNQKLFSYDSKQHIARIETRDRQNILLLAKVYECDKIGNPLLEQWETDSGIFSIHRTFSKYSLTREERSDGLTYEYTYLGNTKLPTSKTTLSEGKLLRKTEYKYDPANNLIGETEVGKHIITYVLYQEGPHLHRPHWKEKQDWEGNLIHKTELIYDEWGYTKQENHYGSDNQLAYRIERTYDSRGNLLQETNPLNQLASYQYDARGRVIQEIPFAQNLAIYRTFDGKGRLTKLQEGTHTTHFAYNSSDELIQKTDYLGLVTNYQYHPVHGKAVSIEQDPTLLEVTYDDFGREIERKDAYQASTRTKLNSYADPLEITHPDGGKETFSYAPNRTLISTTDPDGLTTSYTYDPLKRPLSKTIGNRLTTYSYDAYHLLEEKDPLGISTTYRYNSIGQKIEQTRAARTTTYAYDPLGFLSQEKTGTRSTSYQNNTLGNVLTKSIDGQLNTSYTYDPAGNLASITKQNTTRFSYDPYNRLIKKIEANGAKTTIAYQEQDKLLIKTIQDPKGASQIETYNAQGLLLKKEIPGYTLEEFSYDRALRLASHDHLTFTYTPQGFRASMTEGSQRTTTWTYTPAGKIATKTKPDGTQLHYHYNPQGELSQVNSRIFRYDALGRLLEATGFVRQYDPFGNIIQENLANGLTVKTAYDDFDRPTQRILPDHSSIFYEYEGPFLKKISRLSSNLQYTHTYDQFDLDGHVLSETGLFTTSYQYDLTGKRTLQTSPYFSEALTYDLSGNLIQKGPTTYTYDSANQLISINASPLFYDQHYNRLAHSLDTLNQIQGLSYDANGNLTQNQYQFDEFDQLIQTPNETITYDALGRRLQKNSTAYLYFDSEEIGAFEQGQSRELKIPGLLHPIAIEINNQPYYSIADVQGTLRFLIDPKTHQIYKENHCDPFGLNLTADIPYAYTGKRYDAETGLVYFGKRYYIPTLGRWLTPDPIGPLNHSNLYQYLFNNPYLHQDNNGEFAFALSLLFWGAELIIPAISASITTIVYGAAAGAVVYGGYKLMETFNGRYPSMGDYYSGDLTPGLNNWSYSTMKSGSVDPTLPANPDDLLKRPGWKETTHPEAGKKGHRTFENEKTGEKLRHDQGKPGETGHKAHDHYHHQVPNGKGGYNYVDEKGNPVPPGSSQAHLYPTITK